MATTPYIGSSLPAKIIRSDGTTNLFRVAEIEMGDALCWWQIALLNGLSDPIVPADTVISIPSPKPDNGGLPSF